MGFVGAPKAPIKYYSRVIPKSLPKSLTIQFKPSDSYLIPFLHEFIKPHLCFFRTFQASDKLGKFYNCNVITILCSYKHRISYTNKKT